MVRRGFEVISLRGTLRLADTQGQAVGSENGHADIEPIQSSISAVKRIHFHSFTEHQTHHPISRLSIQGAGYPVPDQTQFPWLYTTYPLGSSKGVVSTKTLCRKIL